MKPNAIAIIFAELEKDSAARVAETAANQDVEISDEELDEIAELRRYVSEICDPPAVSYTMT